MSLNNPINDSITIVIPTHKRLQFLREALESCISQSIPPDEVIVVDDAGDGGVNSLVNDLDCQSSFPIRCIRNNAGTKAPGSRNIGAELASSNYIAFLDDDDLLEKEYIKVLKDEINSSFPDYLVIWAAEFDKKGRTGKSYEFPLDFIFRSNFTGLNPGFRGSNICLRKTTFERVGKFDIKLTKSQDLDLLVMLEKGRAKRKVIDQQLVLCRKHDGDRITLGYRGNKKHFKALSYFLKKHNSYLNFRSNYFLFLTMVFCVEGEAFSLLCRIIGLFLYFILLLPSFFILSKELFFIRYSPKMLASKIKRIVKPLVITSQNIH